MRTLNVGIPYPEAALSPNARVFWARHADAAKDARAETRMLTASMLNCMNKADQDDLLALGEFAVWVRVRWPALLRKRDIQNTFIALKPHIDGIADAMHVNDSCFRTWHITDIARHPLDDSRGDVFFTLSAYEPVNLP